MKWSFRPSEAYDALVFCNAVSTSDFYNRHYPGLRDEWSGRLGSTGMAQIDELHAFISMSGLGYLLTFMGVDTLDDVIACLSEIDSTAERIRAALALEPEEQAFRDEQLASVSRLAERSEVPLGAFRSLRTAGFAEHWHRGVQPKLELACARLREQMATWPLERLYSALRRFLATERSPVATQVVAAYYIKPIAFGLPGGGMVSQPEYLPDAKKVARLCVHESLHGFPGSAEAQAAQENLRSDPAFDQEYRAFLKRAQTGPEEYFVTGAEAYLTEVLGLRTHSECVEHLRRQNGGMPLSMAIYQRLREVRPDRDPGWPGFGPWAAAELRSGSIQPPRST